MNDAPTVTTAADRVVLVDGYSQIYRSYYAIRGLTSPTGQPSNALYGMARFLLSLEAAFPHGYGALVLDKGRPAHRLALLPEYKATRPPMPDDLRAQVEPIRTWAEALGWTVLQVEGFEADDLIAAVVGACPQHEVGIVTQDKDLGQLVEPRVCLLQAAPKGGLERLGVAEITAKFGVPPERLCDYLALVGDTADNIAGVTGVGPKTAVTLLRRFGSARGILEHAAEIERPALRQAVSTAAETLQRNLSLIALTRTLPPDWHSLEDIRRREPNWGALLGMARDYGFTSLLADLEKRRQEASTPRLFA